ncbi:wnt-activated inhibitory factor 2 [Triplophysa rosa]|uniref:Trophoblast glycoprotein-like n=1 Tax=Triplophysa rosa TaxID=992332 RepID=A0A9W7TAN2_TRIRA|nr:wnt-activated inhibitory factor 2 [Triplophysa rosa]KAI7793715.1 putative trophoblast glycoprotein-like [Triplophysa rosa]
MESNRTGRVGFLAHTLKRFHLTVVFLCLCVLSAHSYECPDGCVCEDSSVICVGIGEIKLPLEVSSRTQNLTLQGYTLANLTERAFSPNGTNMELRALSLRRNNIHVIESCAFCGLHGLQTLDLSLNYLTILSPEAFLGLGDLLNLFLNNTLMASGAAQLPSALSTHSLRKLYRLELAGNGLKTVPLHGFGNLDLTTLVLANNTLETLDKTNISNFEAFKKIRVYLSTNPFRCECEHKEFYRWLKNSSQCADASGVFCAHPDEKKGSLVEKMVCKSSDLDAVSYVFLGIVLALIGVVFLMVLYLNRRGIKKWLNNIREACRDQMEVYHYRYEQDSDPRLANVAV